MLVTFKDGALTGKSPSFVGDFIYNKPYLVHCIEKSGDLVYYLQESNGIYYPRQVQADLLDVVDPRLSANWVLHSWHDTAMKQDCFRLSFPRWANDHGYFEDLFDGEEKAVIIFNQEKARLLTEYGLNDE